MLSEKYICCGKPVLITGDEVKIYTCAICGLNISEYKVLDGNGEIRNFIKE